MAISTVQSPPITDPNKPGPSGLWAVWQNNLKNLFAQPTSQLVAINKYSNDTSGSDTNNAGHFVVGNWVVGSGATAQIWIPANPFPRANYGVLNFKYGSIYDTAGNITFKLEFDDSGTTTTLFSTTYVPASGSESGSIFFDFWYTFTNTHINADPWDFTVSGSYGAGLNTTPMTGFGSVTSGFANLQKLNFTITGTVSNSTVLLQLYKV